ncbi:MAG: PadR family transcriptional regulator [Acidobacteriota bacterium]
MARNSWDFDFGRVFGAGFGPRAWAFCAPGRGRRRQQWFESGEMKYVILRLLKEKPRHGYEIIKALEERMGGWYTPSAGTIYPTLQLLEDQGYVRIVEQDGKKIYHITPEGEKFLEENRSTIEEIMDRLRESFENFSRGHIGEVNETFGRLASLVYRSVWRRGPHDERTRKIVEILKKAVDDIRTLEQAE